MQRRALMQTAAAAALAGGSLAWSGRVLAAPADSATARTAPRFLLVFLRGGYDAASLLVPASSSYYREVRPNIAIPLAVSGEPGLPGATPLTSDWALHPALATSVLPLAQRGQARFVPFAGTDDASRSHFETQDSIELGRGADADDGHAAAARDFDSGFLNRLAATLQTGPGAAAASRDAIAFTDQLPLVFRGRTAIANLSLKNDVKPGDERLRQALAAMYDGHPLAGRIDEAFAVRSEAARDIAVPAVPAVAASASGAAPGSAAAMAAPDPMARGAAGEQIAANRNAVSARGFELEARRIARLMRERYTLGFVDVGGWDTHVGQGAAGGYLASRFDELGRGLAAYADELGAVAWRNTTVVVLSEFGRTVRENGNRGTDHGHGSVHWVLGGSLMAATGPVAGRQQAISAGTLFQNRDLPVLNEYRAMLGGLFVRQFGLRPAQLDAVFPGVRPLDIGLL